jgi:hypothetical protein
MADDKPAYEVADPRVRDLLESIIAALNDPVLERYPGDKWQLEQYQRRIAYVTGALECLLEVYVDNADEIACSLDQTILKLKLEAGRG